METIKYDYKTADELARAAVANTKLPKEKLLEYMHTAHKLYELSIQNAETIRELKGQLYIAQAEVRLLKEYNNDGE